jgi:hypothetical protein
VLKFTAKGAEEERSAHFDELVAAGERRGDEGGGGAKFVPAASGCVSCDCWPG